MESGSCNFSCMVAVNGTTEHPNHDTVCCRTSESYAFRDESFKCSYDDFQIQSRELRGLGGEEE
jgi:hypothetical protein